MISWAWERIENPILMAFKFRVSIDETGNFAHSYRELSLGCYRSLGEYYVYGIMDREVMEMLTQGIFERMKIRPSLKMHPRD